MALLPATAVALLKYLEGEDDIFIKNSRLIVEHTETDYQTGPISEYEHDLLKKDWMPPILINKEDRPEFEKAKRLERFRWMRVVIPNEGAAKSQLGRKIKKAGKK